MCIEVVRVRPCRSKLVTEEVEQKGKRALPASVTPQSAMERETNSPSTSFLSFFSPQGGVVEPWTSRCPTALCASLLTDSIENQV